MIAYIIAGVILGFYSIDVLMLVVQQTKAYVPMSVNLLLAFVGGVGGHLVFTLLNR